MLNTKITPAASVIEAIRAAREHERMRLHNDQMLFDDDVELFADESLTTSEASELLGFTLDSEVDECD